MIKNFRLILVTDETMILEDENDIGLSMASGIISAYLLENNINVMVTDTNNSSANYKYTESELKKFSCIYDKDRVLSYISTGNDHILDEVAAMFIDNSCLNDDCYGISIGADFSMMQIHLSMVIATYLKKLTKNPIIIGGNNITYLYIFKGFYQELLETMIRHFDFIIKGPGEKIIFDIIQGLNLSKPQEYFMTIKGLCYLSEGKILSNKECDPIVIAPNWDNIDIEKYRYPFMKNQKDNESIYYRFPISLTNKIIRFNKNNIKERKLFIPYIFNYNCAYKCAFCTQSDPDRSEVIVGEVLQAVNDIEHLAKKYNSNYFYFLNNYFPSSTNFIKTFKEELERKNLKIYWSDCGRVNGLTLEKLQMLYDAGCRKLVFGFESGSEKILDLIDKRIKLDKVVQVLKWCKQVGIWADLELIIGLPYEGESEFMETYNFLKEHSALINNFWLNEYFVVPNSLIGKHPERYNIEMIKDISTYDELMIRNKKNFLDKNLIDITSNTRLWGFNEVNRDYQQMKIDNKSKIERISKLKNKEFNKLFDFYNNMINLRKEKE